MKVYVRVVAESEAWPTIMKTHMLTRWCQNEEKNSRLHLEVKEK